MKIRNKVSWLAIGTTVLATTLVATLGYVTAKQRFMTGIDRQLLTAVVAMPRVLGDDYLQRAATGQVDDTEYNNVLEELNQLTDEAGASYLYVFQQHDGEIVHLASNASPEERRNHTWSIYREVYQRAPAELLATFADGKTRFAEYSDDFGTFRSIFILRKTVAGAPYVVGADFSLVEIHEELRMLILKMAGVGLVASVIAGLVGLLIAQRIARPIDKLATEVDEWATRDFAPSAEIGQQLATLGRDHRDEVGDLARRFVDMQGRLQTYMTELTQATEARQRMENQLEIARSIQESLLPAEPPKVPNFEISGWCKPADQTGGDYFDWVNMPDGQLMITIGDVTGHGIGPALVTAASRAYARAVLTSPGELNRTVARMNDLLHADLHGDRFVTLIAGLLDPSARTLKIIAAGHGPIVYYSKENDKVTLAEDVHGTPLGCFDSMEFDEPTTITFAPGDIMVLVSDGVLDWMDPSGDMFGLERLTESVLHSCREDATGIIDRLRADVAAFNAGRSQHDDTTALVIRCIG